MKQTSVLVAALFSSGIQNVGASPEQDKAVKAAQEAEKPESSDVKRVPLVLERSTDGSVVAQHYSHTSHASHRSHASGFSPS